MIDAKKIFTDYHIPYWTSGKNVAAGWINIRCPFCHDTSNHLGFSPQGNFVCWKCGKHPLKTVLQKILRIDEHEIYRIIKEYGGKTPSKELPEERVKIGTDKFKYPDGTSPLRTAHISYLTHRRFDANELERKWLLVGTGPFAILDDIDFKYRIIAPIKWDDRIVSFQARDYTGKQTLRYITCPKNREIIHHKHILYGIQRKWTDTGICVEGITDVWRFGGRSFATFGIEYTMEQVRVMKKHFRRIYIAYDCEPQAQAKARSLAAELKFRGVSTEIVSIENDPGSMDQQEADKLVSKLT